MGYSSAVDCLCFIIQVARPLTLARTEAATIRLRVLVLVELYKKKAVYLVNNKCPLVITAERVCCITIILQWLCVRAKSITRQVGRIADTYTHNEQK